MKENVDLEYRTKRKYATKNNTCVEKINFSILLEVYLGKNINHVHFFPFQNIPLTK